MAFNSLTRNSEASNETRTTFEHQSASPTDELNEDEPGDVNEKIREQLKLLKMGKCENTLFAAKTPTSTAPSSRRSTISLSKRPSFGETRKSFERHELFGASAAAATVASPLKTAQQTWAVSEQDTVDSENTPKPIGGMINSLFNKLQTINRQSEVDVGTVLPIRRLATARVSMYEQPISTPSNNQRKLSESRAPASDSENSQKAEPLDTAPVELLGFDIKNRAVDVSALLPTPKVMAQSSKAAFISEDLDTFMKENSLDSSKTYAPIEVRPNDEAMVTNDSAPPTLPVPQRPMSMQRPRTLAEKRMYLEQQNDVNVLIIENESTIYHELKKRLRMGNKYNNVRMKDIQRANVPFTRDCWRAACWIATANERYFYRSVRYGNEEIRLAGSYGNNVAKLAFSLPNFEGRPLGQRHSSTVSRDDCAAACSPIPATIQINNLESFLMRRGAATNKVIRANRPKKVVTEAKTADVPLKCRMNMFARPTLAAGPRSQKLKAKSRRSSSFDLDYGPLEIMPLPRVQLETWPHIGIPLPDSIRPLLKMVWSESNVISADRALFATSVLRQPVIVDKCRKYAQPKSQSFVFDIPYENNEKCIIIRRRRRKSLQELHSVDRMAEFYANGKPLSFAQSVDPVDDIGIECANILSDMIDTVAISMNEPSFAIDDPDLDYVGRLTPYVSGQKRKKSSKSSKTSGKPDDPSKSKLLYVRILGKNMFTS